MDRKDFINIFGVNILNDSKNLQVARDLCGIGDKKPWECVGDFVDTAASLFHLSCQNKWKEDIIPKNLAGELHNMYRSDYLSERLASELASRGAHFLPNQLSDLI
jgi:hypothetical protein